MPNAPARLFFRCVQTRPLRVRLWLPYFGRVHLFDLSGWSVIRIRQRFAVVDYSLASNKTRMWIFDTSTGTLIGSNPVRHGDGYNKAQRKIYVRAFSNQDDSNLSSLGVMTGTLPALGGLQKSWPTKRILLLDGQEKKWNSNIRERNIVIHATRGSYSDGCLAMPLADLNTAMLQLAFGGIIYAHYPDAAYAKDSTFLNCK